MFIVRSKKSTERENAGDQKAEAYCGMFIAAYVVFQKALRQSPHEQTLPCCLSFEGRLPQTR